jgi:hypothetical protein
MAQVPWDFVPPGLLIARRTSMMHPGWRRFLPDRSQFMLLVIVVIALVAGMGFVNLGIARNSALAANRTAHVRYDEALQQNDQLKRALTAAQRGENILQKAFDYFSLTLPGVTTLMLQPVAAKESTDGEAVRSSGPPFWGEWWQRLVKP